MKRLVIVVLFWASILFGQNFSIKYNNLGDINQLNMFNDSVYVFGKITPEDAELFINGTQIKTYEKGGFIAYTNVIFSNEKNNDGFTKGIIKAVLKKGKESKEFENTVWVNPPRKTMVLKDKPEIDETSLTPDEDYNVKEGMQIDVEFFGTTGCTASFTIEGINKSFPMVETTFINNHFWGDGAFGKGFTTKGEKINGYYKGCFFITEEMKNAKITVKLSIQKNGKTLTTTANTKGKLNCYSKDYFEIGSIKKSPNLVIGRSKPGMGYVLFLQEDIKLKIIGAVGNYYQAELMNNKSIYVSKSSISLLPAGTPPVKNSVQVIRTENTGDFTEVQFGFIDRVPVEIRQTNLPNKYELYFYNTSINIDWIRFDPKDTLVKEIKHFQENDDLMKVEIVLNEKAHWGYYSDYDGTDFKLRIKHPAKLTSNPLDGKIISIDPGHSPESGAAGAYGTVERIVNHKLSVKLKNRLEKEGAKVYLTRPKVEDELELYDRRNKVNSFKPDISLSMHNNAVPQNMDPTIYNGYSTYYYNPQAAPLAELINNEFSKRFSFRNHGLYCNNLYMCRFTETIAVLVEPFFIINPDQELMLMSDEFQDKVVDSITEAFIKYFKEYSE